MREKRNFLKNMNRIFLLRTNYIHTSQHISEGNLFTVITSRSRFEDMKYSRDFWFLFWAFFAAVCTFYNINMCSVCNNKNNDKKEYMAHNVCFHLNNSYIMFSLLHVPLCCPTLQLCVWRQTALCKLLICCFLIFVSFIVCPTFLKLHHLVSTWHKTDSYVRKLLLYIDRLWVFNWFNIILKWAGPWSYAHFYIKRHISKWLLWIV